LSASPLFFVLFAAFLYYVIGLLKNRRLGTLVRPMGLIDERHRKDLDYMLLFRGTCCGFAWEEDKS
jgi:hypothetical protein